MIMQKYQPYVSLQADENGYIPYSAEEDAIWSELYARQQKLIVDYACKEYLEGVQALNLPTDRVPQLTEVSSSLYKQTGWGVEAVPALISFARFFNLLANKKFPAATFIRRREHMEYLQEPDIFHEIYGHCPLLTNPVYANFMELYGKIGAAANGKDQAMLARLYWFTVEFGLINTAQGIKCYGAGLLSSNGETPYSLQSSIPTRKSFNIVDAFRTPYRYDIFQTVYFVIESFEHLYNLAQEDLIAHIKTARALGMFNPTFQPKEEASEWKNC